MTHDDHALARDLATEAGALLLRLRADRGFGDLKALRDAGDRESHVYLTEALARQRPGDSVLSEEGKDELSRLEAERVWIVDPLDGTREYAEEGRGDWAVHVALWQRDEGTTGGLAAGAVALPSQGRTLSTAEPIELSQVDTGHIRVAVSRSRPPEFATRLAEHLDADVELVPIGSAGAKVAAVLLGDVDAYVHAGGQYEWDSAAPVAVAHAVGAHASRIDGSPLTYNEEDTLLPDILVCHPELAPTLLAGIRAVL
ncbi:3'(2'),5'-bisphosphate nucleotidase CysQ [Actinoallomurus iriomotensis]|uniref:inositol-phosphate phosphatase n=1 Tax=Actinoallomurus iriomotensis TaxID=478107 RepID=A0A9W6VIX8_9ACTN|nr:3'(2'),5'-bisphosphate nucleotidase CysQ [Actinoallomurus iriomotensis]GLY73433.1 3'(2'),5'-bisphosphate nucleotidase CysQ [Actinoallomurus iriomotensis]